MGIYLERSTRSIVRRTKWETNSGQRPKDNELYRAVDEILQYIWDPIGISDVPAARDEYESYVPQVLGLLISGRDFNQVASHLTRITTEQMGLSQNSTHDLEIADVLVSWKEYVDEKYA